MRAFYLGVIKTIRRASVFISIAAVVYALSAYIGYSRPENFTFFKDMANKLVRDFQDVNGIQMFWSILYHNLLATYFTMCFVTLFGVIPLAICCCNGLMLGWVLATASQVTATGLAAMLVPHGIFEWPAMMLSWGIGLWRGLGYRFTAPSKGYYERWMAANKVFAGFMMPLLVLAALIESREYLIKAFFN